GALRSSVPWAQRLDDAFFDFVFFGRGSAKAVASRLGLDPDVIEGLRREFTYWYPVDLRNTGKDLVQNHMTFCLFAHTAIFPKEQWPRGFGVNGWVRLAGRKMSKSRGNVWYIREAVREWGADVIRLTVANAGDGLDDPNVDMDFAESAKARIEEWLRFATSKHGTRKDHHGIDAWFLSVLSRSIQASRTAMEGMSYKAALRHGYFDLQASWSWYVRRSEGRPHADVLRRFIVVQTKLLAPFVPHVAEEIWHRLGGDGFVVSARYPEAIAREVDPRAETAEVLLQSTLSDVREILKVTGIAPKRLALYTAPAWKVQIHRIARELAKQGPISMNVLMERAIAEPWMRDRAKEVAAFAKRVAEDLRHAKPDEVERFASVDEFAMFRENLGFLEKELRVKVEVFRADDPKRWDPSKKADHAVPGRPAIYLERVHEDPAALQAGGALQTKAESAAAGDEAPPVLVPLRPRVHGPPGHRVPPSDVPGSTADRDCKEFSFRDAEQPDADLHRQRDRLARPREVSGELHRRRQRESSRIREPESRPLGRRELNVPVCRRKLERSAGSRGLFRGVPTTVGLLPAANIPARCPSDRGLSGMGRVPQRNV